LLLDQLIHFMIFKLLLSFGFLNLALDFVPELFFWT